MGLFFLSHMTHILCLYALPCFLGDATDPPINPVLKYLEATLIQLELCEWKETKKFTCRSSGRQLLSGSQLKFRFILFHFIMYLLGKPRITYLRKEVICNCYLFYIQFIIFHLAEINDSLYQESVMIMEINQGLQLLITCWLCQRIRSQP